MYETNRIEADASNFIQATSVAKTLNVIDAFSGAGGFSLGFEQAGCRVVGAIEHDAWASETFAANHPNATVLQRDISSIENAELADTFSSAPPTILLGGPPCQGFSVCMRGNGDPHDPRNSLFREFLRIARLFEPDLVVMENVPNIVKARTQSNQFVTNIIQGELKRIGYHVYSTVLEAVNFGVPQIRKRFCVVASKMALDRPFPKPTHHWSESNSSDLFGGLACTRFRGHRVRCFDGTGGVSWSDGSLHASSSLRLCG
jgi:DNA (cytosine-5)-methyltransferase 1